MSKSFQSTIVALLLSFSLAHADKQEVDLLIMGGTIVTMDPNRSVIDDGAVAIVNDRIIAIGPQTEITESYTSEQVIDADGKAVIPGFINGHTHIPMSLFRGIADDLDLEDWLFNYIFPAEAKNVDEGFVRAGTRLGLAEMIQGGTTTFVDMYFFENAIAEEAAKAGMRGVLGHGVVDFPSAESNSFEETMELAERYVEKWKGHPLIVPAIAPHTTYTVSEDHLKGVRDFAKRTGIPVLIHVNETKEEVARSERDKGMPGILYLDSFGFFENHVVAVHVVHPDEEEIDILKRNHAGVIHNPHSNMKLASGIAPIPKLLLDDLNVGIGTDGAASNNDLSIWEEMDFAAKLHKGTSGDPKAVTAMQALEMATIRGARAIRMEKEIGSIEVGKRGDIAIVNLDSLHQIPSYNIYSTLIYSTKTSDVNSVVINGKIVMRDRELLTLDENEIRKETERYLHKIKMSLNMP